MKKAWKLHRRWSILFFAVILVFSTLPLPGDKVQAEEQETGRVIRVPFPEVEGLTQTDGYGNRYGIVVDYLNEIAKYTGWEYEYIDTDGESMLNGFMAGEYDLMGGTYYQESFEKYFAYPDYNMGYSKSVLLAQRDNDDIKSYDLRSLSGKTIGVYERAEENIRRLTEFINRNNIECTLKYYTHEQMTDGNLYSYLENGEVDMLLGNNSENMDNFRVAVQFNSQPYYIVTTLDNQEVLDGLNMALAQIAESNPNFAEECYNANFENVGQAGIILNEEEKEYIRQKGTVSVAVVDDWHPLYCMGGDEVFHNGLVPDVLKAIEQFSGLKFTYIYADDYAHALELVKQGKADILGAFLGAEEESIEMELALTKPYVVLNDIIIKNKSVSFPSEELTGAILEGRKMPGEIQTKDVKYFQNVADALLAVNRGEVDFFYGLSPKIEQEIQQHHYTNVVPNTLANDRNNMSFAMVRPADARLMSILNKAINSMSSAEKETIANQNMMSIGTKHLSIVEIIYANPIMFAAILAGIFIILVISVLVISRSRIHAARMQSKLEKVKAQNRAKSEFLSRMSHEIRTPMNAIAGMSDLICMKEDVPENLRNDLSKIRSSSHYLLNLISDILDMSRIDNEMMTIASEPFSIGRLVDELQSMMKADAERRGIKLNVETEIKDDVLVGDSVRLKQILTNLVSNALKFTPAGGRVTISVVETDSAKKQATYRFRVTDTGVGISEEHQKRIFTAFEQVGTNFSKSQGTGLGLAISKTIVQLMGGELMLHSEPEKGSEFYFTVSFPTGEIETKPEIANREKSLENMHILLAEDNDLNAEIAEELLKMQGAAVYRARNGQQAVEMFKGSKTGDFQAILMDIQMPEMNGLEACRAIRHMERLDAAKIPIIAMTANTFKEDTEAAAEVGMNGFVTKPVNVEYLYHVLQEAAKNIDK